MHSYLFSHRFCNSQGSWFTGWQQCLICRQWCQISPAQLSWARQEEAVAMHMAPSWAPAPCWIQEMWSRAAASMQITFPFCPWERLEYWCIAVICIGNIRTFEGCVFPCISLSQLKLLSQDNEDDLYLFVELLQGIVSRKGKWKYGNNKIFISERFIIFSFMSTIKQTERF